MMKKLISTGRVAAFLAVAFLLPLLSWSGIGGCGGAGGGGGGGTPTAGSTAAGVGSVSALGGAITSALRSTMDPGAGTLIIKSVKAAGSSDDNLSCSCDSATSECECEDMDDESTGGISCGFDHLPGEDDFEPCEGSESISGTYTFYGTATITDAEFDECGQHLILNGTASYTGEFTFTCNSDEPTGGGHISTASACSGITAVDEDGTSHTVGLDVTTSMDGSTTGTICVDGVSMDAAEAGASCDEFSCEDECVSTCSTDDSSCEETCETACEGDDDGEFEDDGGTCEIASCSDDFECQQIADDAIAADDPICGDPASVSCMTCLDGCCVLSE